MRRLLPLLLPLLIISALVPSSALAASAFFDGSSSDGETVVFTTSDPLVLGDTDHESDVYVRALDTGLGERVTREVSIGPRGGNDTLPARYDGMSVDGTKIFFSTNEKLVEEDHDQAEDVYLRDLSNNKTILVSQGDDSCAGGGCGNGNVNAAFAPNGVATDGETVFFTTSESLNSVDKDGASDVYARKIGAEETVLVSVGDGSCTVGGCGNGPVAATFWGIDKAGDKPVFRTEESLSPEDGDSSADFYARDLGAETTELVSVEGVCPENLPLGQSCNASFGGISADGSHVFFETNEKLSGEDTDSAQDVYAWSGGGSATLISIGPAGGNGAGISRYKASSPDGEAVYFLTDEKLVSADTDSAQDVYRNKEGVTTLVSAGEEGRGNGTSLASFDWVSVEGSTERPVFSTSESLVAEDTDSSQDVYEHVEGVTTLVSTGPAGSGENVNAGFAGASADGSRIFFVTSQRLVVEDTDNSPDIYRRSEAGTTLISVGQINGNKEFQANLQGNSSDGSKAFFVTQERLTEGDNDAEQDVYGWSEPATALLISTGNGLALGPAPPALEGTTPASPNPSTTPAIFGEAAAGALIKVYKGTACAGPVIAQGSAEQLASPGLTVTEPVLSGVTTYFSATAEAQGLVSQCSTPISYRQEDALPPPPPPVEEGGTGGSGGSGGAGTSGGTGSGSTGGGKTGGSSGGRGQGGIAYLTPVPRITFGPGSKTRLRRPTFRFLDSTGQPGSHFFCRVDKQRWSQCTSPMKVKKLKLGRHVFSLKAVNAVGTSGASPVKRAFKVVR
jgi:uncharacterized membrane protein YgcG